MKQFTTFQIRNSIFHFVVDVLSNDVPKNLIGLDSGEVTTLTGAKVDKIPVSS